MKRGLALFLAALVTALALTACGGGAFGGDAGGSSAVAGEAGPADAAAPSAAEYQSAQKSWGFESVETAADEEAETATGEDRLANAKMVYTASVEAETMDFDACAAALEELVDRLGGYLEYASTGSYGDGRRNGNYTVRIPSQRFEAFLKNVGEIGHVVSQDQSADNISEAYYDTESRLATQRTKMERLQALLAKAESMEDIISLESAIAETELQIEQLTGSLRHYDALVDFATIEIRLREVTRLSTVEEAPPTFASRLGNAFIDGLYGFGNFLEGLALFVAYNWLWMTLLALIALAVARASRRRRAERPETFRQAREQKPGFFRRREKDEAKNPDDKQAKD